LGGLDDSELFVVWKVADSIGKPTERMRKAEKKNPLLSLMRTYSLDSSFARDKFATLGTLEASPMALQY
jgi:hypothetical protein